MSISRAKWLMLELQNWNKFLRRHFIVGPYPNCCFCVIPPTSCDCFSSLRIMSVGQWIFDVVNLARVRLCLQEIILFSESSRPAVWPIISFRGVSGGYFHRSTVAGAWCWPLTSVLLRGYEWVELYLLCVCFRAIYTDLALCRHIHKIAKSDH